VLEVALDLPADKTSEQTTQGCKSNDDCDDEDPCTADDCDVATGQCSNAPSPDLCPECVAEGGVFEDPDVADKCCAALVAVQDCFPAAQGECSCPNCPCYVCTACGDGECGVGENHCNCQEDCEEPVPSECMEAGGKCWPVAPDSPSCPPWLEPIDLDGCGENAKCCVEKEDCAGEGAIILTAPGFQECCPGLDSLSIEKWDGELNVCATLIGTKVCGDCGNSSCEPWENHCNCSQDCELDPMACGGSTPCPGGMYCKKWPGTCLMDSVWGECTPVPEGCEELDAPVCGCDGVTYANECEMATEQVSKYYDGECLPPQCHTEGQLYHLWEDPLAECCPGLTSLDGSCLQDEIEGCMCFTGGGVLCTFCDNGECGLGETECNCPADCPEPQPQQCHPTLSPCPPGSYCKKPQGKCNEPPVWGNCVQVPAACPDGYDPICGCDGVTYDNKCEMEKAQVSAEQNSPCGCFEEYTEFVDPEPEGKCCPGLVAVLDCAYYEGMCLCPQEPAFACLKCGDGECGFTEDVCNCPDDCPLP